MVASSIPWPVDGHVLSMPVFIQICLNSSTVIKECQSYWIRAHSTHLILTWFTSVKSVFPNKVTLWDAEGLGLQHIFLRWHYSTHNIAKQLFILNSVISNVVSIFLTSPRFKVCIYFHPFSWVPKGLSICKMGFLNSGDFSSLFHW